MPRNTASITEKIQKLEAQKQNLIIKRKEEILKIIEATGSLTIEDQLLASILLFLRDDKNKNHSIYNELKSYLPKRGNISNKNNKTSNKVQLSEKLM